MQDVRPKIEKTVNLFLSKYYIRSDAVQSVQTMCDHVKEELKRFKFYRYRYVVSGTFQYLAFHLQTIQNISFQDISEIGHLVKSILMVFKMTINLKIKYHIDIQSYNQTF